ncbi:MAG: DUF523 domain-containing protein [Deltaproteobacteria bacterium]|nr:DUF523 domain-containing protein [Deltaproteobacteria bacterium]
MPETVLVSACLVGLCSRYDGQCRADSRILDFFTSRGLVPIPVCPEQYGGLSTPRPRTWFTLGDGRKVLDGCGDLLSDNGEKMNGAFIRGALETLKTAQMTGCKTALLKERSPSCGVHHVYLEERIVPGCGVTTALLREKGFKVFNEEELEKLIECLNK